MALNSRADRIDNFMERAVFWPWDLMAKMPRGPLRMIPFLLGLPWVFAAMLFIGIPCMGIIIVLEVCWGD